MNTDSRSHVHALVDQLPPVQLAALETILMSMLDPLPRGLALAPVDDEPFTEADRKAMAEADEQNGQNPNAGLEKVLSELGLTMAEWESMGSSPLPDENTSL
jgi:hypothetical protein